jgi:hypothetical protein
VKLKVLGIHQANRSLLFQIMCAPVGMNVNQVRHFGYIGRYSHKANEFFDLCLKVHARRLAVSVL